MSSTVADEGGCPSSALPSSVAAAEGGVGGASGGGQGRQHPLLLWFDIVDGITTDYRKKGTPSVMFLRYPWLSLGAYYLLLIACAWFVLQRFRRGRPWARARSFLVGKAGWSDGTGLRGGVFGANKNKKKLLKRKKKAAVPPLLLYKDTSRNRRLLSKTTVLRQPYKASPWLGHRLGGHMQSFMFATWCPPGDRGAVSRLVSRKEQVTSTFDGGAFRMDWYDLRGGSLPADAPVVFVLPGVVGQGTNVYIRHLAAHLSIKYGWRVVAKSWRGIGSRLTTRRPETWDHAALSDARDAIRHVRSKVGHGVPIMGAGFSFGGCLLTAIVGSVPQEEHGLCGLVSISGLFDMSSMMRHIAEQYAYPYGFANTKVTVRNYRKFKVLETLSAEDAKDTAGDGRGGSADVDSSSTGSGDDAESEKSISLEGSLEGVTCTCGAGCWKGGDDARSGDSVRSPSVSPCGRERKKLRSESGSATETKLSTAQERGSTAASGFGSDDAGGSPNAVGAFAPSNASFDSSSATATAAAVIPDVVGCGALVSEGNCRAFARKLETASVPGIATAAATASVVAAASGPKGQEQCRGEEENTDQSDRGDDSTETGVTTEDPISSPPGRLSPMGKGGLVSAKEMAAMKDPAAFHEALTLPFTGDSSVEAYFARIESVVSRDVSQVEVPTLCLLARDDPLCPPLAWEGALASASKSNGIIVAITDHGGHCGWFDGLGAGSWLDRAVGDFLASALQLSMEAKKRADATT